MFTYINMDLSLSITIAFLVKLRSKAFLSYKLVPALVLQQAALLRCERNYIRVHIFTMRDQLCHWVRSCTLRSLGKPALVCAAELCLQLQVLFIIWSRNRMFFNEIDHVHFHTRFDKKCRNLVWFIRIVKYNA